MEAQFKEHLRLKKGGPPRDIADATRDCPTLSALGR